MKKSWMCVLMATALLYTTRTALASEPDHIRIPARPISGSYLVVLDPNTPAEDVAPVANALAHVNNGRVSTVLTTAIRAFGFRGSEAAALALSRNPNVAWVEQDGYVDIASTPNCVIQGTTTVCSYAPVQLGQITRCTAGMSQPWVCDDDYWHLDRINNSGPINPSSRAYGWTKSGLGVRAYVVDYGIRATHEEFGNRVFFGANMMLDPDLQDNPNYDNCSNHPFTNCEEVFSLDGYAPNNPCGGSNVSLATGHGTAVASVLGGNHLGVAPGVTLIPVKVGVCNGDIAMLAVARGLDWILRDMQSRPGVRGVVNISLRFVLGYPYYVANHMCEDGAGGYTNCVAAIEYEIVQLIKQGIPVVVAAGNDDQNADGAAMARLGYGGSYADQRYRTITVGGSMYQESNGVYSDARWVCNATRDGVPGWTTCDHNVASNYGAAVSIFAPAWYVKTADAATNSSYRVPGTPSSGTPSLLPQSPGPLPACFNSTPRGRLTRYGPSCERTPTITAPRTRTLTTHMAR